METGSVLQDWKSEALWAPFLVGCRYGPSTWAPRREAEFGMERGVREGRIWGTVSLDNESFVVILGRIRVFARLVVYPRLSRNHNSVKWGVWIFRFDVVAKRRPPVVGL